MHRKGNDSVRCIHSGTFPFSSICVLSGLHGLVNFLYYDFDQEHWSEWWWCKALHQRVMWCCKYWVWCNRVNVGQKRTWQYPEAKKSRGKFFLFQSRLLTNIIRNSKLFFSPIWERKEILISWSLDNLICVTCFSLDSSTFPAEFIGRTQKVVPHKQWIPHQ